VVYQIQLIWNREFHYVNYGDPIDDLTLARCMARDVENSGDGERVKAVRIVDEDGRVIPITRRS